VVRTRSTIAHNAANVMQAQWDKYGLTPLMDCLTQFYLSYVSRVVRGWVQDDTRRLQAYRTSLRIDSPNPPHLEPAQIQALEELILEALETDKSLALLGVDTCYLDVHSQVWSEIKASLDFLLGRLIASGAPPHNLLEILRRAELIGEVSPALREAISAEVRKHAEALFQQMHKSFRAMRAANPESCEAPVLRAFSSVLAAALQCQVIGGTADFPGESDLVWMNGCGDSKEQGKR
jgi:hypothetical protein